MGTAEETKNWAKNDLHVEIVVLVVVVKLYGNSIFEISKLK